MKLIDQFLKGVAEDTGFNEIQMKNLRFYMLVYGLECTRDAKGIYTALPGVSKECVELFHNDDYMNELTENF